MHGARWRKEKRDGGEGGGGDLKTSRSTLTPHSVGDRTPLYLCLDESVGLLPGRQTLYLVVLSVWYALRLVFGWILPCVGRVARVEPERRRTLSTRHGDASDVSHKSRVSAVAPACWCASSSVMHGRQASTWRPSAPQNQADESGLRRIDVELPASLTSQYWSILSRGRLPDLG